MKIAASGLVAAAVAIAVAGTASAQTSTNSYQFQQVPNYQTQQTQTFQLPGYQGQQGTVTYGTVPNAGTAYGGTTYGGGSFGGTTYGGTTYGGSDTIGSTIYQQPQTGTTVYQSPQTGGSVFQQPQASGTVYQSPGYPVPQPYFPGTQQPTFPGYNPPPPVNPNPAPQRGEIPDTDAWTYAMARYYPAIKACLRNTQVKNPVVANIQERRNATVMLIGQGGTAKYQICRTGLRGTRVREGSSERGLPPAFYAPLGSSFTITPDRPFQPVVDTGQRLLGWIVRTQPVRLDAYGGGRTFDGQFIKPTTVNPDAQ